jgi:hypothetical protein
MNVPAGLLKRFDSHRIIFGMMKRRTTGPVPRIEPLK